MIFDKSKVYTAVNADELNVGDIVYVADTLKRLKGFVDTNLAKDVKVVDDISDESNEARIGVTNTGGKVLYFYLAYLICSKRNAAAYKAWHEGNKIENEDPNWYKFHYRPSPEEITKSVHQLVNNTKEYRSFNSIDELTAEFVKRFQTKTPSYAFPLIWVKQKDKDERYLITGFVKSEQSGQLIKIGNSYYGLGVFFDHYEFLDGSPCGVEK